MQNRLPAAMSKMACGMTSTACLRCFRAWALALQILDMGWPTAVAGIISAPILARSPDSAPSNDEAGISRQPHRLSLRGTLVSPIICPVKDGPSEHVHHCLFRLRGQLATIAGSRLSRRARSESMGPCVYLMIMTSHVRRNSVRPWAFCSRKRLLLASSSRNLTSTGSRRILPRSWSTMN